MKSSIVLFALLLPTLAATLPANAQTATSERAKLPPAQFIARPIEARGGLLKIKAIRSLRSVGRVEIGPVILDLSIENPRGAFRSDTSIQGMTKTEAFDGVQGWVIDPFAGKGPSAEAEPMSPEQLKTAELQGDLDGHLVDSATKGHKIVYVGMASVNGVEAYALKISLKNGEDLMSFIDSTSFMEIKTTQKAMSQGKDVEVETTLGDYRPVNGVLFPFSLEISTQGQPQAMKIVLSKVEANSPIDSARFKMPLPKTHPKK